MPAPMKQAKAMYMLKPQKRMEASRHAKATYVLPVGAHDAESIPLKESKDHKHFKYYTYGT